MILHQISTKAEIAHSPYTCQTGCIQTKIRHTKTLFYPNQQQDVKDEQTENDSIGYS